MSFSLTRKTDYALIALAALAREKRDESGEMLSAREIAERHDLPQSLLMNALKELHRAGIIASRRGAGGGYFLDHHPSRITICEVIEAMEGGVSVTICCDEHTQSPAELCQIAVNCPISDPMQKFNHLLNNFLSQITLETLINSDSVFAVPFMGVNV